MMQAKNTQGPPKYYALFSGGKDSITLSHILAKRDQLKGVIFFDTGIHTPDIIPHVTAVCDRFDWDLKIYQTDQVYEDYCLKLGFPSPATHAWIMNRLKGRCVMKVRRELGKDTVLASGIRRKESNRRKFSTKNGSGAWEGLKIEAPIFNMSTKEVWDYVKKNELPRSPAYDTLHLSGDCLCGAFAHKSELKLIEIFYPEIFERLSKLEDRVSKVRRTFCKWGQIGTVRTREQTLLCAECTP